MKFDPGALPRDWRESVLAGRLMLPDGPAPVLVRHGRVHDMRPAAATSADLLDLADPAAAEGTDLCGVDELSVGSGPFELLSPIDLQCVKACGVTFAVSAIERVIEERARGDAASAAQIRAELEERVGSGIRSVVPGSEEAARLKTALIDAGMWSQYLEVAIGPDAEVFTKAPVLSTLGWGAEIGVRSDSTWNNPEPEVVLIANAAGKVVGATLGNDVNLRDFEGRSALLLGKAKDNNASCAIGPFVRLFDDGFGIDDVRRCELAMKVEGPEGFTLDGSSSMTMISRDPLDLVSHAIGPNHQYPDGLVLFLGTMFAPTKDRFGPGQGFTHAVGDIVTIATPKLGALVNRVNHSDKIRPWSFGAGALMTNLAKRGLL
jgi:fumarylacetoacetate (FAA) hydrolase family protein